ncbi:gametogenetin-binding protein 1-like isoform X2 [Tamandua tetradactyla]|uniref:gametogenetin-binding protein 1-like isoform X2 n=1 Tax=Tamandua tetradactyla TaxID=48850 RepID=UPI0040548699
MLQPFPLSRGPLRMEAPTPMPPSRVLGRSSLFHFFRSLVGSKSGPRGCGRVLVGACVRPSQEQDAVPLTMARPAMLPCALSVAMPRGSQDPPGPQPAEVGGVGAQPATPLEVLPVMTQSGRGKSGLLRGSQEVLDNLSEKEEEEEEEGEAVGEACGDTGASGSLHFAQALEVEQGCLRRAMGALEVKFKALTGEEEKECLLDGDLRLASSKMGTTPWSRLLSLYKQLQKSAMAKFPFKEGLPHEEEKQEKEMEEEDNYFNLCVPGTAATFQSPLYKTLRSTDTAGFMESELEKFLAVQRESHLWKASSQDILGLNRFKEAGNVDGQGHQAEGERSRPPAFGECWGPGGQALRQLKHHRRLERRVQSPLGGVSRTEHLLLEEMDEMGNWPPE